MEPFSEAGRILARDCRSQAPDSCRESDKEKPKTELGRESTIEDRFIKNLDYDKVRENTGALF